MDENYLKTLRILELEPSLSQRVLALRLNLSLGKTNSLLNSMINAGHIQAVRFRNSNNKRAYRYDITSEGLKCKLDLACRFLQVKARECEELKEEIESLKQEILENPIRTIRFTGLTECYSRK